MQPPQTEKNFPDVVSKSAPNKARAQRNYYQLAGAAAALKNRLQALRRHVLPGSVLDIGCNDGTITNTLLKEGYVSRAQGIDLEVLHNHFPVFSGDILDVPIGSLGVFDNVFYLNVHHHLIASTYRTQNQTLPDHILSTLLANCRRMFFEMGSITEQGSWSWLKILRAHYGNDDQALQAILGQRVYYEVLQYPMQGGRRRMLVVVGNAPDLWNVDNFQWYARNVAAYPLSKRLAKIDGPLVFPPGPVGHAPNDWMPHVKFITFRHNEKVFFGKLHDRRKYDVPLTFKIYDALRHTPFSQSVVQPLYYSTHYGIVWEYDQELMMPPFGKAVVVHLHDVSRQQFGLHDGCHKETVAALANCLIKIDGVQKRVRDWCDFQTIKTSEGLRFIDFDAFSTPTGLPPPI